MSEKQQSEIERWIEATGRQYPEQVTYTQDEARFWHRKADESLSENYRLRDELSHLRLLVQHWEQQRVEFRGCSSDRG